MNLEEMRSRVRGALKDLDATDYLWSSDEVDAAISRSLEEYSAVAMAAESTLLDGDGVSRDLAIGSPEGYLYALAVEHPIGEATPRYLRFVEMPAGAIRILGDPPEAGVENVRLWYARGFSAAADPWNVPIEDLPAVELGAVAHLALGAARYSATKLNGYQTTPRLLFDLGNERRRELDARLSAIASRPSFPGGMPSWGEKPAGWEEV